MVPRRFYGNVEVLQDGSLEVLHEGSPEVLQEGSRRFYGNDEVL